MNVAIAHSVMDGSSSAESAWDGLVTSEPVAAQMAISTLYLHDVITRRNQQSRGWNAGQTMPDIKESPDEDDCAVASAALNAAVQNLQVTLIG